MGTEQTHVDGYVIGWVYANLRERDRTLSLLEKAYEERSSYMASIKVEPSFDFLRENTEFLELQRRIGLGCSAR